MKSRHIDVRLALDFIWKLRGKLRAEGNKLWAEGNKLCAEGDKLRAEGNKLWAEGDKLWAEGNKLRAEGNKLWAEAIIELIGNVTIQWTKTGCVVDDDLIFTHIYET